LSRYTGPKWKLTRREGFELDEGKNILERRPNAPGEQGRRRRKLLGYGLQLREKQKVKRIYGIHERQFRLFFKRAERQKGVTGENLLRMLEQRLDNTVFRLGFTMTRRQARQLVTHCHVLKNGKKANIPSMIVEVGDVISIKEKSRSNVQISESLKRVSGRGVPEWLDLKKEEFSGKVLRQPYRKDVTVPISEQLIVELYSK
jgi:small subunit ribosomal protein S4